MIDRRPLAGAFASDYGERYPRAVLWVAVFVGGFMSILVGAAVPLLEGTGRLTTLVGCAAVATYAAILCALPVPTLPIIGLLTTLLVPTSSSLLPVPLQDTAVGAIPLAVWLVRSPRILDRSWSHYLAGLSLAAWLVLSEAFAPLHTRRGYEWLGTAFVCIALPALRQVHSFPADRLRMWFLRIVTPVGGYALLEAFVLHRNVLFAVLFRGTSWWAGQQASVSYRVTTLFGHPLVNGLIFAMAGTVAAANFVERRGRPQIALCQFATIAGAVLATHSRGPAIALGGGVLVVVGFSRSRARGTGGRRFLIAAGAVCTAGIIVIGLQARNQSQTGQASAALRQAVVSEAFQAIKPLEPFGAGPGQAEQYRTAELLPGTGGNGNYHPLENSYAELLVSIGPVGLLLFLTLIGLPTVRALRNPDTVGEGAALCAWLIAVAGFNAIEGFPAVLVLAALFISTFTPVDASELTFAGATRPRPDAATPSQTHQSKTRSLKAPASG